LKKMISMRNLEIILYNQEGNYKTKGVNYKTNSLLSFYVISSFLFFTFFNSTYFLLLCYPVILILILWIRNLDDQETRCWLESVPELPIMWVGMLLLYEQSMHY